MKFRNDFACGSALVLNALTCLGIVMFCLLITSCGSTKVYTADKTIAYRDTIFNVSNTKVFTRKSEAVMGSGETTDIRSFDRRQFGELLEQNNGEVMVRQSFVLDDTDMVYQAQRVNSWSDFTKMSKRFDSASKDIQKFLADKKKTQLKLR